MAEARVLVSYLAWGVFWVIIGCAAGYGAYADPNFCSRLSTLCKLPPAGYGFWLLCVCAFFLLSGCLGVARLFVVSLLRSDGVNAWDQLRLKCEICMIVVGGFGLLLLLFIGFMAATFPGV